MNCSTTNERYMLHSHTLIGLKPHCLHEFFRQLNGSIHMYTIDQHAFLGEPRDSIPTYVLVT